MALAAMCQRLMVMHRNQPHQQRPESNQPWAASAPHPPPHGSSPGWGNQSRVQAGPMGLDEQTAGTVAHLCFFLFPVAGPLAIALTSARGTASRQMASQAAAVQIATYVGMFVSYVVMMIVMGVLMHAMRGDHLERLAMALFALPLLVLVVIWLLGLWGSVAGASAANRGVVWRMPLLGRAADAVLG